MKKKLISMLLAVLMIASLFSGMGVSAHAANDTYNTVKYTLVGGDYVLRVCQRMGLNFYICKDAIMRLNNITEKQWRFLAIGREILLPASDADAVAFLAGKPASGSGGGKSTTPTSTPTPTATATPSKKNNDVLAYYLVPYTMGAGETVIGVCAALGTRYNNFNAQVIKAVNGLKDWTTLRAGSTYLFPVTKEPMVGTSCKAVYLHKIASGDTAYSIATDGGINYYSNADLIKSVNPGTNLNKLKVGGDFYYPVDYIVPASNSSSGSSSSSSGSSSGSSGSSSGSSSSSSSTAKTYKLATDMTSTDGTMKFFVDSKEVGAAAAGEKVHVMVSTEDGKAVKKLTVKHMDGKADLVLTGDTFIMPECDVRVMAEIASGHPITLETNYSGKAIATVGGLGVTSASRDSKVMIVSNDPAYEIESVSAYYRSMLGLKKDLAITNNGFVMPEADVTVKVTLKPVTTYDFYVTTKGMGNFFLSVNGGQVSKAAKGAEVKIVTQPMEGYTITGWTVTKHGDPSVNISVFNNTFIMPGFDVDVEVVFGEKGNNIVFMPAKGGSSHAEDGSGNEITEADTGDTVTLVAEPLDDYKLDSWTVVRNKDGYKVTVTGNTFVMPAGGVTVTPVFVGKTPVTLTVDLYLDGKKLDNANYLVEADVTVSSSNGNTKTTADVSGTNIAALSGDYVSVSYNYPKNTAFDKVKVTDGTAVIAEYANQLRVNGFFELTKDNTAVTIEVYFVSDKISLPAAAITGVGTVGYVDDATEESITTAKAGDTVRVSVAPGVDYVFDHDNYEDNLKVTRKDNGAEIPLTQLVDGGGDPTGYYSFVVPDCGIDVQVTFKPVNYRIVITCVDEKGVNLTGLSLWSLSVDNSEYIVDNNFSFANAKVDDLVMTKMTKVGQESYNLVKFMINSTEYTKSVKNFQYSFVVKNELANGSGVISITAVMRPKAADKAIALKASINNEKFGNVGFLVTASPTGYSVVDGNYDKECFGGDTVVIIPSSSAPGYTIDEEHISITQKDGGVIHPTPVTVDGKPGYQFVMPNDGYKSISVNFYPISYNLKIKVVEEGTSTDLTAFGYATVKVGGASYKDVFSPDALGTVPYTTKIEAAVTNLALNSGWKLVKVEVDPTSVKTTKITNGISFEMPAQDAEITVTLKDGVIPPTPPTPTDVTLPNKAEDADSNSYNLQYYKDAAMTEVLTDLKVKSGETYYVKLMSAPDGAALSSFEFLDDSNNPIGTANTSTGQFTVPADDDDPEALVAFSSNSYKLKIAVENAPDDCTITVEPDGGSAVVVTPGSTTIDVNYGQKVTITASGSTKIEAVDGLDITSTLPDMSAEGNVKPADSVPDGSTITATVKFPKHYKLKINLDGVDAETANVKVEGVAITASGTVLPNEYLKTDKINFEADRKIIDVTGLESFTRESDTKGYCMMKEFDETTVTVTVSIKPVPCALKDKDEDGNPVKYFKEDGVTSVSGNVDKGYTVVVKGDPYNAKTQYVKSITITDADDNVTKINDGDTYTVNADIKTVEVEKAVKRIKVKLVVEGGPDDAVVKMSLDKSDWSQSQISNVKNSDKFYIQAAFSKISTCTVDPAASDVFGTTFSSDGDTEWSGTFTFSENIKNGDTVTVTVKLVNP